MHQDSSISLRPATQADEEFLYTVYASTRRDEVAAFGWDEAEQQAFLRMQFGLRERSYRMQFPFAEYSIILLDGAPAGQMIVNRTADAIQITDIAVLPEYRKNGIATSLIGDLQDESRKAGKPLTGHVDRQNEIALRVWSRLGFIVTGETEVLFEIEWNAPKVK